MTKTIQKIKRQKRIRIKLQGTKDRPRLTVFRSNKYMYVQLIDDIKGETVLGVSEQAIKDAKNKGAGVEKAKLLGVEVAKQALSKKIKDIVFDKGSYAYHGRVKAVADGAREGGLHF